MTSQAQQKLKRDIGRINRREMGAHWQRLVAHGHGPWHGDTNLVLKEYTDIENAREYVECWYELPGDNEPQLVLRKPAEDFDIDLFCHALWQADNRNVSAAEKAAQADKANQLVERAAAREHASLTEEAAKMLAWEIRREHHPGAPRQHYFGGIELL